MVYERKYDSVAESTSARGSGSSYALNAYDAHNYRGWRLPFGDVIGAALQRGLNKQDSNPKARFWAKVFPLARFMNFNIPKNRTMYYAVLYPLCAALIYTQFYPLVMTRERLDDAVKYRWIRHNNYMQNNPRYREELFDIYSQVAEPPPRDFKNQF